MGGSFTNSTDCDVAPIYGMHNMDLGKQNAVKQSWVKFNLNLTSYKVPSEIISVIGGSYVSSLPNISTFISIRHESNMQSVPLATPKSRPPPAASTTAISNRTSTASTRLPHGHPHDPFPVPPRPPMTPALHAPSVPSSEAWSAA